MPAVDGVGEYEIHALREALDLDVRSEAQPVGPGAAVA